MTRDRQGDLRHVAGLRLDAALAALRQAVAAADALAGRIAELDTAIARQHDLIAREMEAPVAGPVLDRWGAWAARERARLNGSLALARAEVDRQRLVAAEAFGRAEALRLIEAAEAQAARRLARRRR